jgi:hypothetical protein
MAEALDAHQIRMLRIASGVLDSNEELSELEAAGSILHAEVGWSCMRLLKQFEAAHSG